jgi:hypothetical protein
MRVGHHGSWCIRVFWHQVGTKPSSTIPELGIPHSLSCLTDKMVGLGLKRLHAAFYDGERLFAHHSVVRSDTTPPLRLPMRGASLKLIAKICRPFHAVFERSTQSVQRQQAFNNTDDFRGRRGSVKKSQGAMFYGLPHVSYLLSLCRDNKRRARIVKPIETEQGIAIE